MRHRKAALLGSVLGFLSAYGGALAVAPPPRGPALTFSEAPGVLHAEIRGRERERESRASRGGAEGLSIATGTGTGRPSVSALTPTAGGGHAGMDAGTTTGGSGSRPADVSPERPLLALHSPKHGPKLMAQAIQRSGSDSSLEHAGTGGSGVHPHPHPPPAGGDASVSDKPTTYWRAPSVSTAASGASASASAGPQVSAGALLHGHSGSHYMEGALFDLG